MPLLSEMKSLNNVSRGKAEIQTPPLLEVADDRLLVRVTAVGLNPTDWKDIDSPPRADYVQDAIMLASLRRSAAK
jgi:hypothetical protein